MFITCNITRNLRKACLTRVLIDISDHARLIRKLYSELSPKIDAQTVADYMFQQHELTHRDLESIQSRRSKPIRAAEHLLNIIIKQSRSVYWCFLDALTQSHQEPLRKMILLESPECEWLLNVCSVKFYLYCIVSVSYTHLTLPTNREV